MGNWHVVKPAYGRDYKSQKAALADWTGGKDFLLCDVNSPWAGKPCSIRDFSAGDKIEIRYSNLTKLVVYTIK